MDKLASLLHTTPAIAWMVLKVVIVFAGVMSLAAIFTWVERRGSAMIQDRIGPNRAALFGKIRIIGLAQILADGIKMFFKEDLIPTAANRGLFFLAPFLAFVPALLGFAVIPFGRSFVSGGTGRYFGEVTDERDDSALSYDNLVQNTILHGSPDTVIRKIEEFRKVGATSIMLHYPPYYGPEKTSQMLRLFAREVLPHVHAMEAPRLAAE